MAIGYPDLVSVFAGTTLNQTGQAIEIIAMTMESRRVVDHIVCQYHGVLVSMQRKVA